MSDEPKAGFSKRSENLDRLTVQSSGPALVGPGLQRQLSELAVAADLESYFGSIAFVGRTSNGDHNVQFNDENANVGYSSAWPEWAFAIARDALMGGKKVTVLANGQPSGSNLIQILVFA